MNNGRGVEHLDICYFAQSVFGQPEHIPAPPKCARGFIYPSRGLTTTRNTFTHTNTDSSSSLEGKISRVAKTGCYGRAGVFPLY